MVTWEKEATRSLNRALTLVREERMRVIVKHGSSKGGMLRRQELSEIESLLQECKAHIDVHDELPWEFQEPLPF